MIKLKRDKSDNLKLSFWKKTLNNFSNVGKSLLFPIATLPIAALLLRIGNQLPGGTRYADFMKEFLTAGGNVMFENLHIIFAVGIAFGLTKGARGEAALAGFIGIALITLLINSNGADLTNKIYKDLNLEYADYAIPNAEGFHRIFSTTKNDSYDAILANNVLTGVIIGLLVSWIYNKFQGVELPSVLGFFSGKRLIPVMTVIIILLFGILYAVVFPWIGYGLYKFSIILAQGTGHRYTNAAIMGVYGTINRLLIPLGLHHIPNTLFWFTLPVIGRDGNPILDINQQPIAGDIFAFLNGVPKYNTAGTFQSGFFPIMMFGLPAMASVFYFNAENKEQKKRVLAMFGSAALVSFLTGITEPIEFAFLFISPPLFIMHALFTGVFSFIVGVFGIQLGFGFSAGLIDYILSIPKSMDIININREGIYATLANPGWIFPIGFGAFATYFFTGNFLVKKFNVPTPGRGQNKIEKLTFDQSATSISLTEFSPQAQLIVKGFGGWDNITAYGNCTTRLRYDIKDIKKIDEKLLKRGGAIGIVKMSNTHVQIIIGPNVEILNNIIIANQGKPLSFINENQKSFDLQKKQVSQKANSKTIKANSQKGKEQKNAS